MLKSILVTLLFQFAALPVFAQDPSAICTNGLTALTREIGEGIPLPRQFSNPTSREVQFTVTMRANPIFGRSRVVLRRTLPAGLGTTMSEPPVMRTGLWTPVRKGRVIFDVTSSATGNKVVGQCDYALNLTAPNVPDLGLSRFGVAFPGPGLIQVPLRICILQGTALSGGRAAGQIVEGGAALGLVEQINREIWFEEAGIAFTSPVSHGFPVIADEGPSSCGVIGDVQTAGFAGGDGAFLRNVCADAWADHYPTLKGVPVIFARRICNSGLTLAAAPKPPRELFVASHNPLHGKRGDDLCGRPVTLRDDDVSNLFVVSTEPAELNNARNAVAHEFGHILFLGHGNGLDDNGDGRPAGFPGSRRYDEYCDPAWLEPPANAVLVEDKATPFTDCKTNGSLMLTRAQCQNLQKLQIETARGVSLFLPGARDTTPQLVVNPN